MRLSHYVFEINDHVKKQRQENRNLVRGLVHLNKLLNFLEK